jgi:hypothetical protein
MGAGAARRTHRSDGSITRKLITVGSRRSVVSLQSTVDSRSRQSQSAVVGHLVRRLDEVIAGCDCRLMTVDCRLS